MKIRAFPTPAERKRIPLARRLGDPAARQGGSTPRPDVESQVVPAAPLAFMLAGCSSQPLPLARGEQAAFDLVLNTPSVMEWANRAERNSRGEAPGMAMSEGTRTPD